MKNVHYYLVTYWLAKDKGVSLPNLHSALITIVNGIFTWKQVLEVISDVNKKSFPKGYSPVPCAVTEVHQRDYKHLERILNETETYWKTMIIEGAEPDKEGKITS